MYRKLPLFFAFILLSDLAYAEASSIQLHSNSNTTLSSTSQPESTAPNSDAYARDLASMPAPDAATQACLDHLNTTDHFLDPSTTKLLSSTKKWVTVKDVGGRQMVTIRVVSKNEAGMYVGSQQFNCLLMGDNVTVNKGAYELL